MQYGVVSNSEYRLFADVEDIYDTTTIKAAQEINSRIVFKAGSDKPLAMPVVLIVCYGNF